MSRGGRQRDQDGPERKCVATGEVRPKGGLVRFVADPAGELVPDILGKLPGHGVYVSADSGALDRAVRKNLLQRGIKEQTRISGDLREQTEGLLARHVVELISLARKSGKAVAGYEKVRSWLGSGRARVLIQASDGSAAGKSKLAGQYSDRYIGWITSDELGAAFGRETVVHAALASGRLAERIVEEAQRLRGLRKPDGGSSAGKGDRLNDR